MGVGLRVECGVDRCAGAGAGPEQRPALPAWGGGEAVGGAGCLQEGDDSGEREGLVDLLRSSHFIPRTVGSIKGF